jgi:MFS family permease
MFSVKKVFIIVVLLFVAGSSICAAAQDSIMFIIGRVLAGIGGGGIFGGALTIIAFLIPLHRRPLITGSLSALFGVRPICTLLTKVFKSHRPFIWRFGHR